QSLSGKPSYTQGQYTWGAIDLDGDGREELIYVSDQGLTAYSPHYKKNLWTWGAELWAPDARPGPRAFGLKTSSVTVEGIQPPPRPGRQANGNGVDRPLTLVVVASDFGTPKAFFGLNPKTGETRWRCDAPRLDNPFQSLETNLSYSENPNEPPLLTHHFDAAH